MEKATIIPNLFEVECPPEKIRTDCMKYQTLKPKCLVNKNTGVTSCKYVSCDWAKCSIYSKTVVLKLPSKNRKNTSYYPCVLWNYETGETFSLHGFDEFVTITIEGHETHLRSFYTIYNTILTCNALTGEELPNIINDKEDEVAIPFIAETGNLVWKINKSSLADNPLNNPAIYEDIKLTSINDVDLWMVKHHKNDDWWLQYDHKDIASSKTGNFIKKGFYIFGQIESDRYRLFKLQTSTDFKEVSLEVTDKSIILDKEEEIPLSRTKYYPEEVIGLTTDCNWLKTKSGKAYPVLSPETQGFIPRKIELCVRDESFVPCRSYYEWAHHHYPKGTVAGFNVTNIFIAHTTKLRYAVLKDLDTDVEIVVLSSRDIFKKGETVYLQVIRSLHVENTKELINNFLPHKAVVEPGYFAAVSEEEYHAFKKRREENKKSEASQNQPELQQRAKEPEPSLLEKKIPELESFVKYLLHEVEGEVTLNVQKDADGNVKVSIL